MCWGGWVCLLSVCKIFPIIRHLTFLEIDVSLKNQAFHSNITVHFQSVRKYVSLLKLKPKPLVISKKIKAVFPQLLKETDAGTRPGAASRVYLENETVGPLARAERTLTRPPISD